MGVAQGHGCKRHYKVNNVVINYNKRHLFQKKMGDQERFIGISSDYGSDDSGEIFSAFEEPKVPLQPNWKQPKSNLKKTQLSKSTANLIGRTGETLKTANDANSKGIGRSESVYNLTSSGKGAVTALEIRELTNNFQKLLGQATLEIKKLTAQKVALEEEQGNLLTLNVELATETKQLLQLQREWRTEKMELINANEEFAAEVEKLYKEEEIWEQEA